MKGPAYVRISNHAEKRIRKRRLDHRKILKLMWTLPYVDPGRHEYVGDGMTVIYADDARIRHVVTAWK